AHGHFGPLDCAIFADTGWEPAAVYEHLRWLMSPNVLPFPVHIVSARNLRESLIAAGNGKRWASIPAFTRTVDRRGNVSIGMIRRQCTTTSKIEPIRRKVRELAGLTRKRSPTYPVVHQWLGISMDEVVRMKPSRAAWQLNRFPLIESRMTRKDCLDWLKSHGYPKPPKGACIGCPFYSDAMWRSMRNNDPAAWDDAVEVDRAIRTGLRGIRGEVFLHRSGVPLDEADLSTAADHGQLDVWPNECEGMCGL
ncbi:MAG: hypothetical protein EOS07_31385, partial [Mesorhizobium sp.]